MRCEPVHRFKVLYFTGSDCDYTVSNGHRYNETLELVYSTLTYSAGFEMQLWNLDGTFSDKEGCQSLFDRPFNIPKTTCPDIMIEIPTTTLKSDIKGVFFNVTVPDIIARVGGGSCGLCDCDQ